MIEKLDRRVVTCQGLVDKRGNTWMAFRHCVGRAWTFLPRRRTWLSSSL